MKTFLKVLLIVVGVVIGLKVLRLLLWGSFGLIGGALGVMFGGLSLAAGLMIPVLLLVAVLSPVWLPIAAIVAVVAVWRRSRPSPAAARPATPSIV